MAKHIGIEDHSINCKGHLTIWNVSDKFRLHELYSKWILCRYFKVVQCMHCLHSSIPFITPTKRKISNNTNIIGASPSYICTSVPPQRQLVLRTGIFLSLKVVDLYQNTL